MNLSILDFDIGLVLFYLLLTLGIGVYKGWGVKTLKDFSIGKSEYSNIALIATITATFIGGASTVGIIGEVYSYGIIWFVIFLGEVVELCLSQLFAARVIKFRGALSVAEYWEPGMVSQQGLLEEFVQLRLA